MWREVFGGVWLSEPLVHPDSRGTFHEWFKASEFEEATGFPFDLQQANISTSKSGVLRGLHFADVPPGQAKFVSCVQGRVLDVVVDVRAGSPTFKRWQSFELSADNRHSVYVPIGFAHGFVALEDSTVAYLTTSEYDPSGEHEIDPFDPELGIEWPEMDYVLSVKDKVAPKLAEVELPHIDDCTAYETMLRDGWVIANQEVGE
ncbi:dTDP-4-dehydrorhamnose 3,5-epimerase [Corynebacterium epidermidicanis]|nr:dTDP-4-dehydrorhamnose 3,5-epimerase [Corynebacterium epidermidicanis]